MLFLKYALWYIPTPVLDGLFLYLAVTALYGNQMFERILLFFMEPSAYPPNSYIRRVPEKIMHYFTCTQIVQLGKYQKCSQKQFKLQDTGFFLLRKHLKPIKTAKKTIIFEKKKKKN